MPDRKRAGRPSRRGCGSWPTWRTQARLAPLPQKPCPEGSGSGLAQLAARTTGDAHGLDEGRLVAALVLRAVAAAHTLPWPADAAGRRQLWQHVGVAPDQVSGTVMTFGVRPPGAAPWSVMLRARADLGLVTYLTLAELLSPRRRGPCGGHPAGPHVCENPQVLQAAAQLPVPGPLVCTSGMPSAAGWHLLERLHAEGAVLRYHGDFDWPGIAIASQVLGLGAEDYRQALTLLPPATALPLTGEAVPTVWDPALAEAIHGVGHAVHEETVFLCCSRTCGPIPRPEWRDVLPSLRGAGPVRGASSLGSCRRACRCLVGVTGPGAARETDGRAGRGPDR
ncbi:DUF2399 domain-containing protein [Kitasatospora sp. NPDC048365]|uniref:DUF2399 domain-containing protein n=1 Tax=Kitasatospora sp. NPDC048365 TaxID=3364050 RepID=UPI0037115EA9